MEQTPIKVGQNFLAGLTNGLRAGQMTQQINRQNALAQFLADHGEGLSKGDPTALAGYAAFDPQGAFSMGQQVTAGNRAAESHTAQMQFSEARLAELRAEGARAAQTHAAQMSDFQRQESSRKLAGLLSEGSAAYQGGPEQLNAWVQSHAQEMVANNLDPADFTYETFPGQVARYEGLLEGLSAGVKLGNSITQQPKQSAAEAELARLMEFMPREIAVKVQSGVYKSIIDPVTREPMVIDMATRQPVFTMGQGAGQPAPQPGIGGVPRTTGPVRNPSMAPKPFGQEAPPSPQVSQAPASLPPLSNAEDAFGIEGGAKGAVNAISDAVGLGTPFENVRNVQDYFAVLSERLTNGFAQTYGRQPTGKRMDQIQALTAQTGALQGAEGAKSKLRALQKSFQTDLDNFQRKAARRMNPRDREKVQAQIESTQATLAQLREALSVFGDGAQSTTSSGVKWSIER